MGVASHPVQWHLSRISVPEQHSFSQRQRSAIGPKSQALRWTYTPRTGITAPVPLVVNIRIDVQFKLRVTAAPFATKDIPVWGSNPLALLGHGLGRAADIPPQSSAHSPCIS